MDVQEIVSSVNDYFGSVVVSKEDLTCPTTQLMVKFLELVLIDLNVDVEPLRKVIAEDPVITPIIKIQKAVNIVMPFIKLKIYDILSPDPNTVQHLFHQIMGFLRHKQDILKKLTDESSELIALEEEWYNLQLENDVLIQMINSLNHRMMTNLNTQSENISLNKRLKELELKKVCLEAEKDKVKTLEQMTTSDFESSLYKHKSLIEHIAKLQEMREENQKLSKLKKEIASLEAEQEKLKTEISFKRDNIEMVKKKVEEMTKYFENVKFLIDIYDKNRENRERQEEKRKEIERAEFEINLLKTKIANMQLLISQCKATSGTWGTTKTGGACDGKIEEVTTEISKLEIDIANAKNELLSQREELNYLHRTKIELENKKEQLRNGLEAMGAEFLKTYQEMISILHKPFPDISFTSIYDGLWVQI